MPSTGKLVFIWFPKINRIWLSQWNQSSLRLKKKAFGFRWGWPMQCIKVGVIGAGGVAQVEHIPNLLKLHRQFKIVGVYDPSPKVRAFVGEEFGLETFSDLDALLAMPLD